MGTDATAVIEMDTDDGWETIGIVDLPRCYDMFEELREKGMPGYPRDICYMTRAVLEALESFGEVYMSYDEFLDIVEKYAPKCKRTVRRKLAPHCRAVCRFDN